MNIFDLRNSIIYDYATYIKSFIKIHDTQISTFVEHELFNHGALWPQPLIQLNPLFARGETFEALIAEQILHPSCAHIFRRNKSSELPGGDPLFLHKHQEEAIRIARQGHSYVLTTGTGSGKSLAYIIPIVNYVLRHPGERGIKAIVVYPMNALANSQKNELDKYLQGTDTVRFARYTGQESQEERAAIIAQPPDILLTNYVMLELILTRPRERDLLASTNLHFLVLDELHTYRGRQGADVALLVRRVRDRLTEPGQTLQCVGTSATLVGGGSYDRQRREVAQMASRLFGTAVYPEHIISETLVRTTRAVAEDSAAFRQQLRDRVLAPTITHPRTYAEFIDDPLSIWLESTFGITTKEQRLVRTRPLRIAGEGDSAAARLAELTGASIERCSEVIQEGLLAGYEQIQHPQTGRSPFAFRLHQFISKGDMVYASLDVSLQRYLTIHYQQFVPGTERGQILLPLVFCRECGQEYYCVRVKNESSLTKRELNDRTNEEQEGRPGYLYLSADNPWPRSHDEIDANLPDDWKEERPNGHQVLTRSKRELRPQPLRVRADGELVGAEEEGIDGHFLRAPFRFCLRCNVEYDSFQDNDFAKLSSLSSEGRSTSTTILSLSAIRHVNEARQAGDLQGVAPKLLSFTDNRQDASLQAGHFNDYIEIGLLRSALYQAVRQAGAEGLAHDTLTTKVFEALHLPLKYYAVDEKVKYAALLETNKAFRNVLGYRLYRDLKRGWRITSPNLEQSGLLTIDYLSLNEVCEDVEIWQASHPALRQASPATRAEISKTLLDYMRRELVIKVDYLDRTYQDTTLQQQSNQRLIAPWALDELEKKEYAPVLLPRSKAPSDDGSYTYLSGRSSFGRYLRRNTTFKDYAPALSSGEAGKIIIQLLEGLKNAGLVEMVQEPDEVYKVAGYQLPASALIWRAGSGEVSLHDPIRVPQAPVMERSVNAFFRDFYRQKAEYLLGIEAREHTAQVTNEERIKRENDFRANILPILYCSPTMELGVDIAELNLVNMRNIPPTPANYAQRSGRAGRSGQPALVFSYCSTGSSHDQYFFRHPEDMVQGAVSPPRLDLLNEDLVRAHIHAIWLAETNLSLEGSLKDLLDVAGQAPTLRLLPEVRAELERVDARQRAEERAKRVLATLPAQTDGALSWLSSANGLATILDAVAQKFDEACNRWRRLYETALEQFDQQTQIIRDSSRAKIDKEKAKRLLEEATAQLSLLTNDGSLEQSDFYSYRYMASEGFLPGYNFPRLPLAAYIAARGKKQRSEYLSRPRFLAISEFAPRAIIYHEGSRYVINRALLTVAREGSAVLTRTMKQCSYCGYLHWQSAEHFIDTCEYCHHVLNAPQDGLFRLQSVSTVRRDRISSDEEERQRQGYDIRTALRFASFVEASLDDEGEWGASLGRMTYGQSATLSRINFGALRRKSEVPGFLLDTRSGEWKSESDTALDRGKVGSQPYARVIPYVEDTRNCLLFEPDASLSLNMQQMASLQSALKSAIQLHYQLEDNELAVEPLPDRHTRHFILFYESSEGGAGVLRQLVDDPFALQLVARKALRLCHYDPETGEDLRWAESATEACEAACYNCLMTYANQRDHLLLDRASIRALLLQLCRTQVNFQRTNISMSMSTGVPTRTAGGHERSGAQTVPDVAARDEIDEIARAWLLFLREQGYQFTPADPPASWQGAMDFYHAQPRAAIYIDGSPEHYPERRRRDEELIEELLDSGCMVLRFGAQETWAARLAQHPTIFRRTL